MIAGLQTGVSTRSAAGSEVPQPARGKLKIFFGMAPGVGKTRAMIEAAQKERLAGRDVLLVCLQDSSLVEKGLTKGLVTLSSKWPAEPGPDLSDSELDAVLARRPDIAVMDALSRDNGPNRRHPKRYLDVLELLEAGIDVMTTLNVGQVASWSDDARRIIRIAPGPLVPDTILDWAELELVDLAPRELIKQIRRGEVQLTSEAAKSEFLDAGKLMALRELAVRAFAQRVGRDVREHSANVQGSGLVPFEQRLMVVLRPDCDNEPVLRFGRRVADGFHAEWLVVYIEPIAPARKRHLPKMNAALSLARELGADVVTTSDADPVAAIFRVAAQRNATQLIVGHLTRAANERWFPGDDLVPRVLERSGELGVHLVPVGRRLARERTPSPAGNAPRAVGQYASALGFIVLVTLPAFLFTPIVGAHATALVYLLTVVLLALFFERGPTLAAAALSAVIWDYFFLPPVFAFQITHFEDAMLFAMYFIVALVLGNLTSRIRAQETAERERETRATALYLLTRDLNESIDLDHMIQRVVGQLGTCFKAEVAVFLPQTNGDLRASSGSTLQVPDNEASIPRWVFQHRQKAGKHTSNAAFASAVYIPLTTNGVSLGVLGLRSSQGFGGTLHQANLMDAVSQQVAMALDRHRLNGISERAKLLAESERLSKTLLDSISHEVRTPIAVITSATGNLAELKDADHQTRRAMIAEIQEATERLNRLVGNMLEASRLESGSVKPRINECDVRELIHVVLASAEKELAGHPMKVEIEPQLPVVPMDFVLMQEALANLLSNVRLHTPPGTPVELTARLAQDVLQIIVADRGPGIPADSLARIFDKFYRVPNSPTGGTGLGLSLVKGFVEAQGGIVTARNRRSGGVAFEIRIPLNNVAARSPGVEI